MSDNDTRVKGTSKDFSDNKGKSNLLSTPVTGIVKSNIDPTHSGKIKVYINKFKGNNPDDPASWVSVSYLSPFFGYTPNTGSKDANGTYMGNPNSYGFWATPPDIGTEVMCIFENGDSNFGYYIGSIVKPGINHMVPAIGSSDNIIANAGEAGSYGGATRLPVAEYNNANEGQSDSPTLSLQPRPVHSYQAAILSKQGLIRDPDRGTIGSSSTRETPSRVFGMSTPGRPIYEGGYSDSTISAAIKNPSVPDKNFKVTGRVGGHSFVMDDGDLEGRDQLVRLRTATGHMIMMSDSADTLFIVHSSGQSYVELGKAGTIDMYSTNSINVRTHGDLNLHADNNMNIHVEKELKIRAENIRMESVKETSQLVGTAFKQHTKGNHTNKVDGQLAMDAAGNAGLKSGGTVYINGGPNVNLNTGSMSITPEAVNTFKKNKHTDTLYDAKKGYASAPGKLESITSRAPAHSPWEAAGQGVDVKVNLNASANFPSPPSASSTAAAAAAPSAPPVQTSPTLTATVPPMAAASNTLDKNTTTALVSQTAVNAATGASKEAVASTVGVVQGEDGKKVASIGPLAITPNQLADSGCIKPGTENAIQKALDSGKSLEQAMPANFFTGKDGVNNLSDLVNSKTAQTGVLATCLAKGEAALKQANIIGPNESPMKTGGLILSAATKGITSTVDFVKNSLPSMSSLTGAASLGGLTSAASSLGLNASKIPNPLGGSVGDLISGGNFASGLADKALGGLGLPTSLDSAKGSAEAAFASVTSKFKEFKAGVPISLTEEKLKVDKPDLASAAKAAAPDSSSLSSLLNKATSSASSGISSLIDGAKSMGSSLAGAVSSSTGSGLLNDATKLSGSVPVFKLEDTMKAVEVSSSGMVDSIKSATSTSNSVPGMSGLSSTVNNVLGSVAKGITPGLISNVKNVLSKQGGLIGLAASGLDPSMATKLQASIASLGAGGGSDFKLPTIAPGGSDVSGVAALSKQLLGDPKIPALKLGESAPPTDASEMLRISRARTAASDKALAAQEVYEKSLAKTGSRIDPATAAAFAEWKQAIADMDKVA